MAPFSSTDVDSLDQKNWSSAIARQRRPKFRKKSPYPMLSESSARSSRCSTFCRWQILVCVGCLHIEHPIAGQASSTREAGSRATRLWSATSHNLRNTYIEWTVITFTDEPESGEGVVESQLWLEVILSYVLAAFQIDNYTRSLELLWISLLRVPHPNRPVYIGALYHPLTRTTKAQNWRKDLKARLRQLRALTHLHCLYLVVIAAV